MEKTIEDEIKEAMNTEPVEVEEVEAPEVAEEEPVIEQKEAAEEPVEATPAPKQDTPPVGLTGAIKAKWNELPEDVRAEWKKREDDIHRMMTAKEGELNLGRSVKEIATPYEAIIRAEGGTIEGAFRDLMNTAYVLRTGSPQQKLNLILQTAQQFGVDLGQVQSQQVNPLSAIQQEIQQLRQQADPVRIKTQLQEEMERDRIQDEINAFAANPANVHYQAVRTTMGSLIQSGRAKGLQEAYEMAIWSDPSIRSELLKAQEAQAAEKKKAEMAAKKKASASVVGSYGTASPSTNAPQKSLEDEIRDQMRASSGKI